MNFYNNIEGMELVATCADITQYRWDEYMKGVKRANTRKVNALVKKHLPELYDDLALQFRNPYPYYRKNGLIVLVHSAIEYFIKIY